MANNTNVSRREALKASAGLAGVSLLAGCTGGGDGGDGGDGGGGSNGDVELPSEIEFTIPYGPGGGFDTYVRLVSPHLQEELAEYGVESVVPENREGAGGVSALNRLMNQDPDGSEIAICNVPGHILVQLQDDPDYDMTAFTHVGFITKDEMGVAATTREDWETYDDLIEASQDEPLICPNSSIGSNGAMAAVLMNEYDPINIKIALGFDSSPEQIQTIIQGNADIEITNVPTQQEVFIEPGDGRPIVHLGPERHELWPDTPTRIEAVDNDNLVHPVSTLTRAVVAPPDMPSDAHEVLSDALITVLESDDLQAEAEEADRSIIPGGPDELSEVITEGHASLEDNLELFEQS